MSLIGFFGLKGQHSALQRVRHLSIWYMHRRQSCPWRSDLQPFSQQTSWREEVKISFERSQTCWKRCDQLLFNTQIERNRQWCDTSIEGCTLFNSTQGNQCYGKISLCSATKSTSSPRWEGPYKVIGFPHPNAYVLEDRTEAAPRTFNADMLWKFYC